MSNPKPKVHFHGHFIDCGQHTVELSINGTRYEYALSPQQADTVEFLCRKGLALKALNFAKSRARLTTAMT